MKKTVCFFSVITAVVITICYMRIGGIEGNASALSKVGLSHPVFFCLWGVSTYFALAFNLHTAYGKTKYKFYIPLLAVSLVGMVLTLTCRFEYSNFPVYMAHCVGSLTFSAVMGVSVFLLFQLTKRYVSAVISGVVLLADLVLLLIYKETALIEVVPVFVGYVLLLINNLRKENVKIEAVR